MDTYRKYLETYAKCADGNNLGAMSNTKKVDRGGPAFITQFNCEFQSIRKIIQKNWNLLLCEKTLGAQMWRVLLLMSLLIALNPSWSMR